MEMSNLYNKGENAKKTVNISGGGYTKDRYVQALRGISICAVVLTHCLGKDSLGAIYIKPWLYFQVMLFTLLSGYLTTKDKVQGKEIEFYKKRLTKTLIPYVFWTFVYLIYDKDFTIKYFVKCLLTAKACGPLYYLLDYAQLVILTPLFYWLLEKKWGKVVLYAVTPMYIGLNYLMQIKSIRIGVPLCFWLILPYIIGLEKQKYKQYIRKTNCYQLIVAVVICGVIETLEGINWRNLGIVGLMNTQVKITSLLYFLSVGMLFFKLQTIFDHNSRIIKAFSKIGDFSFGIFCCHKLFIFIISKWIPLGTLSGILLWIVTMIVSFSVVWLMQKFLSQKICGVFGFV